MSYDVKPSENDPHAECAAEIEKQQARVKCLLDFLYLCDTKWGRIVSMADLNDFQIAEAKAAGYAYVNDEGFGFALLPWNLTTDRDRERETPSQGKRVEN